MRINKMLGVTMDFPSCIKVSKPSDRGSLVEYEFEICEIDQWKAILDLLVWITPKIRILLSDHRRGDSEGGVIVQIMDGELKYMRGGHGYSSDWFSSPNNEAADEMYEAAKATKWGPSLGNGTICVY